MVRADDVASRVRLVVGVLFVLASVGSGLCQAPETFSQALSRHGIVLTKPSLIEALRNPDKEVRGLAAAELAEWKATDSLPEILRAGAAERNEPTKVNIAAAATWLGSSEGLGLLKEMCLDQTLDFYVRQNAARNVFDKRDHACFRAVADMMLPSASPDSRIGALYLLSQLNDRTEEETGVVLNLLVGMLTDADLRVRLESCEGLRWLKRPEAIAPLRNALANEREDIVRQRMESTLDFLGKPRT
ncbi:HEAT repeat domain-containing protein [Tunturiibacter gelidoferens]|uniref:HEAT repeat protein n=1 Tax=Tunturiibacter lichenicola TaxID=2051959 RepID=A0A7Y9NKY5_9BACT|nr:HEAT repeat domain-containing protein [Edaphobacter lichenicola]NYF51228.1 HEAT repeat protein [Edaphobacter lichenicola]